MDIYSKIALRNKVDALNEVIENRTLLVQTKGDIFNEVDNLFDFLRLIPEIEMEIY